MNKKLVLLAFIQKRQSVTLEELHQFAMEKLQIYDRKYLYSAYLYSLLKQGHIVRQRRGLYSMVDVEYPNIPPNPYLLASKLRQTYYLGYASALDLLGVASVLFTQVIVAVKEGQRFNSFEIPKNQPRFRIHSTMTRNLKHGLRKIPYNGKDVIISSPARTCFDVVDRPHLAGGWEEVIRSLDLLVSNFQIQDLKELVFLLDHFGNKSMAARVGFLLERFASIDSLSLPLDTLAPIQEWVSKGTPTYLFNRSSLEDVSRNENWNLYVPVDFDDRYFAGQRLGR